MFSGKVRCPGLTDATIEVGCVCMLSSLIGLNRHSPVGRMIIITIYKSSLSTSFLKIDEHGINKTRLEKASMAKTQTTKDHGFDFPVAKRLLMRNLNGWHRIIGRSQSNLWLTAPV